MLDPARIAALIREHVYHLSRESRPTVSRELEGVEEAAEAIASVKRRIVAAAIRQDGMVCSVPREGRHGDVIRAMATAGIPIPIVGEQGFLTSDGHFVDRVRAKQIAVLADQIMPGRGEHRELFSEDVW